METFFATLIVLLITSWLWVPALIALSPVIGLILIGVRDSMPFLRSK